jgi:hypothetical protein
MLQKTRQNLLALVSCKPLSDEPVRLRNIAAKFASAAKQLTLGHWRQGGLRISRRFGIWFAVLSPFALVLPLPAAGADARPMVMIVSAYHFVSKANVYGMEVDDPMSSKRQIEIENLARKLAQFRPTRVVVEETAGTSDIQLHYTEYLAGRWSLEPSENYQLGFRIARRAGLGQVDLINALIPFDFEAVSRFAATHGQQAVLKAQDSLTRSYISAATEVARMGTITDIYRFYNSPDAIRRNNAAYMYLARIGDDRDFIGAKLVADWHLRNLEMFAKLTRLIRGPNERVLVLYGQGHSFLLREFVRESPDLALVDPTPFLQ